MADQTINLNTTTAIAVPQRKITTCPMKKWVLTANHTTNNSDIFGDNAKAMSWTPYLDFDPNHYFTEVANTNGNFFGSGAHTDIRVNYAGYYMFSFRFTIEAAYPVVQNTTTISNLWAIGVFDESNGWSPKYAFQNNGDKMLGSGSFPTGTSSVICRVMSYYDVNGTASTACSTSVSKVIAAGVFGIPFIKETYLSGVYLGLLDGQKNTGFVSGSRTDPFYTAMNLGR